MEHPNLVLSPHNAPRFPPKHTRAASRSPTRPRLTDDLLTDLSPSTTLEAFTSTSGASRMLRAGIEAASPTQRAFGIRAALAAKKIHEWRTELAGWPWPTESGSEGFENPVAKRRKLNGLSESFNGRTENGMTLAGGEASKEEYWGSLPARTVEEYETRLDEIAEDMKDLDVEAVKSQVLDSHHVHGLPRTRPSTSTPLDQQQRAEPPAFFSYNKIDDFTAVVTATVLKALPDLAQLMRLMDTWSVRLAVLRQIPQLMAAMSDAERALESAWTALDSIDTSTQTIAPASLSQAACTTIQITLQEKVTSLGALLDTMLDKLEGREDTLPEEWLDRMEGIETEYGEWSMAAERMMREQEWTRRVAEKRLSRERKRSASPTKRSPIRSHIIADTNIAVPATERAIPETVESGSEHTVLHSPTQTRRDEPEPTSEPRLPDTSRPKAEHVSSVSSATSAPILHDKTSEITSYAPWNDASLSEPQADATQTLSQIATHSTDVTISEDATSAHDVQLLPALTHGTSRESEASVNSHMPQSDGACASVRKLSMGPTDQVSQAASETQPLLKTSAPSVPMVTRTPQPEPAMAFPPSPIRNPPPPPPERLPPVPPPSFTLPLHVRDESPKPQSFIEQMVTTQVQEPVKIYESESDSDRKEVHSPPRQYDAHARPKSAGSISTIGKKFGHPLANILRWDLEDDKENMGVDRQKGGSEESRPRSRPLTPRDQSDSMDQSVASEEWRVDYGRQGRIESLRSSEEEVEIFASPDPLPGFPAVGDDNDVKVAAAVVVPLPPSRDGEVANRPGSANVTLCSPVMDEASDNTIKKASASEKPGSEKADGELDQSVVSYMDWAEEPAASVPLPENEDSELLTPATSQAVPQFPWTMTETRDWATQPAVRPPLPETKVSEHDEPLPSPPLPTRNPARNSMHITLPPPVSPISTTPTYLSPEPASFAKGHARNTSAVSTASAFSGYATSEPSPEIKEVEPVEYFRPVSPPIIGRIETPDIFTPTRTTFIPLGTPPSRKNSPDSRRGTPGQSARSEALSRHSWMPFRPAREDNFQPERPQSSSGKYQYKDSTPPTVSVGPPLIGTEERPRRFSMPLESLAGIGQVLQAGYGKPPVMATPSGQSEQYGPWTDEKSPFSNADYEERSPSLGRTRSYEIEGNDAFTDSPLPALHVSKRREPEVSSSAMFLDSDSIDPDTSIIMDEAPMLDNIDISPARELPTVSRPSDGLLQQQISEILQSIPSTQIRLASEPPAPRSGVLPKIRKKVSKPLLNPATGSRSQSRAPTPAFTLAPAYDRPTAAKRSTRGQRGAADPEIKLYHLSRTTSTSNGDEIATPPIKLFVRLVGERGERVMVRVGGGWADLGEYLREWAVHHGRAVTASGVDGGRVEIRDVSPATSRNVSGTSTIRGVGNRGDPSPANSRPASALDFSGRSPVGSGSGSGLNLNVRKARRSVGAWGSSPATFEDGNSRDLGGPYWSPRSREPSTPQTGRSASSLGHYTPANHHRLGNNNPITLATYLDTPASTSSMRSLSSSQYSTASSPSSTWMADEDSSFREDGSSAMRLPTLGLAGPKGKERRERMSDREREWVSSVEERVRVASSAERELGSSEKGRDRRDRSSGGGGVASAFGAGSGNGRESPSTGRSSAAGVREKPRPTTPAGFGELGKVGGVKRLFKKGA